MLPLVSLWFASAYFYLFYLYLKNGSLVYHPSIVLIIYSYHLLSAYMFFLVSALMVMSSLYCQVYTGSGTGSTGSSGTPSPSFFPVKPPKLGQGIKASLKRL
jgi:hypothetical protein